MEVSVSGVDASNAVLAHEHGRVRIMHQVPAEKWEFGEDLRHDSSVAGRWRQHAESRRGEQRLHELPCAAHRPRSLKNSRVCAHTKKFIDDGPCEIPGRWLPSPSFDQRAASLVRRRVRVRGVDQDIGVDDEHARPYRPSMAW